MHAVLLTCQRCTCFTLQTLEKQLETTDSALTENSDRIQIMTEHLNNVQQELKYTQSRVRAPAASTACGQPAYHGTAMVQQVLAASCQSQ